MHSVDPDNENVPTSQRLQTDELLAPDINEYVPTPQIPHILAPVEFKYVPGIQAVQIEDPETLEYVPISQGTHSLDPANEYVPAGHSSHTDDDVAPTVIEKVPAGQILQLDEPVTDA